MKIKQLLSVWVAVLIVLLPVQTASALSVLSKVERIGSTDGSMDVVTDVPAEVKLKYGTTRSVPNELNSPEGRLHIFSLTNLVPDTSYYYKFELTAGGQTVPVPYDTLYTFKTLDAILPQKVTGLHNLSVGTGYVNLAWDAVTADKDVDYYRVFRDQVLVGNASDVTFTDTGLEHQTTYVYNVAEVDTANEQGPLSDPLQVTTLERDLTPPIISGAKIVSISATTATFEWATNEPADTTIIYGANPVLLDQNVSSSIKLLNHSITIRELVNGTKYYYRLMSCDSEGNCVMKDVENFIAGMDIIPPFINTEVPEYVRAPDIEVEGTTEPFAFVSVYVNGGITGFLATDVTGRFSIHAINLLANQPNTIRVEAQDQVGNKASREFTVILDTKAPVVNMTELPELVSKSPFSVQGSVNEPVTLTYKVSPTPTGAPERVTNLQAPNIGANSVTLTWHAVEGVNQYIVYREDQGRIAVVTNTSFTDTRVKTGANYEYQVSALAANGEEGQLSSSVRVATLPNGQNIDDNYPEVNMAQYLVNLSTATYEVTEMFNFELNLVEGKNYVTITFTDVAGNVLTVTREITYDKTAPKIIAPTSIEQYYSPSYSPTVTIKGKVDTPGATVIVTVNERVSGAEVMPTSLFGIIEHFRKQGESYIVTADENGDFSVDIELERVLLPTFEGGNETVGGGATIGGAVADITGAQAADIELESVTNNIRIVAVDPSGLMSEPLVGVILYKVCGVGGAWEVTVEDFSPMAVYSEHLLRGMARFGFNMKLKYRGTGPESEAVVNNVDVRNLPLSQYALERYSDLLEPAARTESNDKKTQHLLYKLKKWPGSEDDLRERNQLRFPLIVEIDYKEKVLGKEEARVQKQCIDLRIEIEHRIDIEGKIPEAFLNGSIGVIEDTVEIIEDILKPLTQAQTYLFWGCLGGMGLNFLKSFGTESSCFGVKTLALRQLAAEESYPGTTTADKTACTAAGTDAVRCQECVESIKSDRDFDELMGYICDRMFCPSVPSVAKHAKEYKSVFSQSGTGLAPNACTKWDSTENKSTGIMGDRYFRDLRRPNVVPFGGIYGDITSQKVDDNGCKNEYEYAWDSACLLMDEWQEATTPPESQTPAKRLFGSIADLCSGPDKPQGVERTVLPNGNLVSVDGVMYFFANATEVQHGTVDESSGKVVFEGDKTDVTFDTANQNPVGFVYDEDGQISEENKNMYFDLSEPPDGVISGNEIADSNIVKGSDGKPIQYGKNSALDNNFQGDSAYVVNPAGGIIRSLQCACLPAVIGYLDLWKNILNAIKKCFQSILVTKKADSGLCKSVLTVYLCDFVFEALSCIGAKYTTGETATAPTGIAGFFGKIGTAFNSVSDKVKNRYGETSLFKTMFSSQKLVHAACYAAFTGDWNLDIEALLAGEARIPIDSEVWLFPTNRRFITSDPTNKGLATYIYSLGTGIIAGADLDYRIDLVCTTGSDCQEGRNPGGTCDCALTKEKQEVVYTVESGSLKSGEILGDTAETGDRYIEITQPYRFNKARITYWYTDNTGNRVQKEVVKDISLVGARPPTDCEFDIREGMFRCSYVISENGEIFFADEPESDQDVYYVNDTVNLDIDIIKRSPEFDDDDISTAKKQLPAWLAWRVENQNGAFLIPPGATSNNWQYVLMKRDGEWTTNQARVRETQTLGPYSLGEIPDFKIRFEDFQNIALGQANVITTIERFEGDIEGANVELSRAGKLTGSATPSTTTAAETFAVCFYGNGQKYEVFSGAISADGKTFTATNLAETNKSAGGDIVYHGVDVNPTVIANNGCIVVEQTSLPSGQVCQDGDWKIHLKLHHALPRNPDQPLSYDNYQPAEYGSVTMYNDEEQSYVIKVPVRCGVEEEVDVNRCDEGYNGATCKCYKTGSRGAHDFNCGGTTNPFCVWGVCLAEMNFKTLFDEAKDAVEKKVNLDQQRIAKGLGTRGPGDEDDTLDYAKSFGDWLWIAGTFVALKNMQAANDSLKYGWDNYEGTPDEEDTARQLEQELGGALLARPPVSGGILFYNGYNTRPPTGDYILGGTFQSVGADCKGQATAAGQYQTLVYDKAFEGMINLTKAAGCPSNFTKIVEFNYNFGTTWGFDGDGNVLNADDLLRLCVDDSIAVQMYFHRVCGADYRSEGQLRVEGHSVVGTPLSSFNNRETANFCVRKQWHDVNACGT